MMREFGVKFECRHSDEEMSDFDIDENDRYFDFEHMSFDDEIPMLGDIAWGDWRKIYVKEESEEIFKPKDYDLAVFTREDGISTVGQYSKDKDAFINGNFRILKKMNPKIIMRDNKHFIDCEVENE